MRIILSRAIILVTAFMALLPAVACEADNAFGINAAPHEFPSVVAQSGDLGLNVVRIPLDWQEVEPQDGVFDWSETDSFVDQAASAGLGVLFTIRAISSWGTEEHTQATESTGYHSGSAPQSNQQWAQFVGRLAARYQGDNVYFEIGNEVNSVAFWSGSLEDYTTLLQTSYSAIKTANPDAIVLSAAMGCGITKNITPDKRPQALANHDSWLAAILATGSFDVVSVHNYYFPSGTVANGATFQGYLDHIKELMNDAGVADRPIWITEAGYISKPTNAGGRIDQSSPDQQATWLQQAYQQAAMSGVEKIFWMLLYDRDEPYFGSMGLGDIHHNQRPAWQTMQGLSTPAARRH